MDLFTKNRFTIWLIILLVVMNVLTLSTLWFHQLRPSRLPDREQGRRPDNVVRFLRNELNFSETQIDRFRKLRDDHFRKTHLLTNEIFELKSEILQEIFSHTPDTAKVAEISAQIGARHVELEKLTFIHFRDLKALCQIEQRGKLEVLLHELFRNLQPGGPKPIDAPVPPPGDFRSQGNPPPPPPSNDFRAKDAPPPPPPPSGDRKPETGPPPPTTDKKSR